MRVATGAQDDGRGYWLQLALACLGWLLTALVVVLLAFEAGDIALQVSLFLAAVCLVIALVAVAFAVVALRPPLMRGRTRELEPAWAAPTVDALGRPTPSAVRADQLDGEIAIEGEDPRRYVGGGRP